MNMDIVNHTQDFISINIERYDPDGRIAYEGAKKMNYRRHKTDILFDKIKRSFSIRNIL